MHLKVLFDPADGRLLGAQAVGVDGVDKRIDVLAVAIRAGMTIEDLEHLELAYAPPYGSAKDPVNMAGFIGGNVLRGDVALWYAEEWPVLPSDAVLLDVRSALEHADWSIPGSILIPHKELRARLDEVPARAGRSMPTAGRASARTWRSASSCRTAGRTPARSPAASSPSVRSTRTAAPATCSTRSSPTPRTSWPRAADRRSHCAATCRTAPLSPPSSGAVRDSVHGGAGRD